MAAPAFCLSVSHQSLLCRHAAATFWTCGAGFDAHAGAHRDALCLGEEPGNSIPWRRWNGRLGFLDAHAGAHREAFVQEWICAFHAGMLYVVHEKRAGDGREM